jgi:transcriptional regulator with XRE-family HTH domain
MNVQRVRKARGWSQEELGEALTKLTNRRWSSASVSAAESSWRGGRVRRFDANELVAFSLIFKLPVSHFLLPPTDDDLANSAFVVDTLDEVGLPVVTKEQLLRAIWDVDLPAEFIERLKLELRSVGHEWSDDRHTIALHVDDDMLPRIIRALENVAGLDVIDGRPELPL